jgi:quinol monooxygenase YgiN
VKRHYPGGDPKPAYVVPWEQTPAWEQESAAAVYSQVKSFIRAAEGWTEKLSRRKKGQFIAICWVAQIHRHFPSPKPSYVLAETVREIQAHEPSTLLYAAHRVEEQPQVRMFYELYRDRAAFDAHEAQPHTRRFLVEREQYLADTQVDFLTLVTGAGLPDTERETGDPVSPDQMPSETIAEIRRAPKPRA